MEYCQRNISAYISIFKDKYGCQCTTPATHVHQPILKVASVFAQHCAPFHSPTFQTVFTPSLSQDAQSPRYQRSHRTPNTKTFKAHLRGKGDQTTRALRHRYGECKRLMIHSDTQRQSSKGASGWEGKDMFRTHTYEIMVGVGIPCLVFKPEYMLQRQSSSSCRGSSLVSKF